MERLAAEIAALNEEVLRLRSEVQITARSRDIAERLASGLADTAEQARAAAQAAHDLLRRRVIAVAAGLTVWALVVAYGAVWWHELVRNECYPVAALIHGGPVDEPWFCGIFPGTNRHHQESP